MFRREESEAESLEVAQTKTIDGEAPASGADAAPPSPSVAASPYWGKSTEISRKPGFSPLVGFCFTINYILGTGFLTVPWAFAQGGLALSAVVIVAVGMLSDVAKNFLLETMARAEAMLDGRMHWIERNPGDEERQMLVYSSVVARCDSADLLQSAAEVESYGSVSMTPAISGKFNSVHNGSSLPGTPIHSLPGTPAPSQPGTPRGRRLIRRPLQTYPVKRRKFEVNTLCRVFLGKLGLRVYTGFLCLYIYCTLWAYTSVFAASMAGAAPLFADGDADSNYLVFAVVFAAMVVPLSCMEMDEQVPVQVAMTGARFLMLGLMIGTSSLCALDSAREEGFVEDAPMVRLSGISKMAPVMVFAHIYHHSIPGLAHPVADKEKLSGMFRSTTVFSTVAYACIGLILSSSFGGNIEQSANLNWKGFTGGTAVYGGDGQIISIAWWAKAISLYVLCFPALDVVSAFPLNAMTLGNNMMGAFYGRNIHEVEKNRWIRTRFRLMASVPPIVFGILERQLGTITDYAGTTGFVIGFSFPALLYLRSRTLAKRKNFSASTFYAGYSSSNAAGWFLFLFGLLMVVYVVFFLVMGEDSVGVQ